MPSQRGAVRSRPCHPARQRLHDQRHLPVRRLRLRPFRPRPRSSSRARRPTNRRQSAGVRSGRSTPGDDTSSTYLPSNTAPASRRASMARDARAQSSTVTFSPSRRSMRTSSTGLVRVPPRRSSTRSKPSESSSATTTSCSAWFMSCRGTRQEQKNVGNPPPHSPAQAGRQRGQSRRRPMSRQAKRQLSHRAAIITPNWRPRSPARCEKNRSLSQRVQYALVEMRRTPRSLA